MKIRDKKGFTLAEMMIVLLVLSIVIAAMVPIFTSKKKSKDLSDPIWEWAISNNGDAYFAGAGTTNTALIGVNQKASDDRNTRLILNSPDAWTMKNSSSIIFKKNNVIQGHLNLVGNNIALGKNALIVNEGNSNIAIGYDSLISNKTGGANMAFGVATLHNNTTGGANMAFGSETLYSNTTGSSNIAFGNSSLFYNTTGSYNIVFGSDSLNLNQTGSNNIVLGRGSCNNVLGSNKTCIGNETGPALNSTIAAATNTDKVIWLGDANTKVFIPGSLYVDGKVVIDADLNVFGRTLLSLLTSQNTDHANAYLYTLFNNSSTVSVDPINTVGSSLSLMLGFDPSDRRLKNIKGKSNSGLEQIRKIQTYEYTFKKDKTKEPHVGVIAQELQKIFPNAVKADKSKQKYLSIRLEDMFYAMLNSIKELDKIVQNICVKVQNIEKKLIENDKINNQQSKQIKLLENQNKDILKRLNRLEKKVK